METFMPVNFISPTFAAGELTPQMYARVDLAKYHAGLKLCRNFFILPQGGAANRAGTMFVGRCWNSSSSVTGVVFCGIYSATTTYAGGDGVSYNGTLYAANQTVTGVLPTNATYWTPFPTGAVNPATGFPYATHLIPFQFNLVQTYVLEFGHQYMRVIMNGGYVLEPTFSITSITNASPGVLTVTDHGYATGDQVFIAGTATQLDSTPGRQYLVNVINANSFSLYDLDYNPINTTNYSVYYNGLGTVARVFTMPTPYNGADVQLVKWAQSNDTITLCHPNYPPADLTRTQHWIWNYTPISFAPTMTTPGTPSVTAGATTSTQFKYSYVVTAITNSPPDESFPSAAGNVTGSQLNSNTGVFNTISWTAVPGAAMYRIYKANPLASSMSYPTGMMYGYIGTATGTTFVDVEIAPDFTQSPPLGMNPFAMGEITAVSVTNGGTGYDAAHTTLIVTDITGSGAVLTPTISGGVITGVTVTNGGKDYTAPSITPSGGSGATATLNVQSIPPAGQEVTVNVTNGGGGYVSGQVSVTAASGSGCTFKAIVSSGAITEITVSGAGTGYSQGESLTITATYGGSAATFSATVTPEGNYPACCCYFQQRKVFAGGNANPQTVWMTKPADFKNMDISSPSQSSDAITATIASNQVNAIKWMVPMNDLVIMTSGGTHRIIGGAIYSPVAVTPTNIVIVPQSYIGCADLPPIVVNYDILYVQAKGSIVRDLAYNFFANVYTGNDMSVLSNHLFFGHNMERWTYAEQPFYQIWTVRDDGVLLSFTYLKEQDVYAWAHHDSMGNSGTDIFLSVASIPEQQVPGINVDSVYLVVQRIIPGINRGQPVQYVERMDDRNFLTGGVSDVTKAWFLDCALQYSGPPTNTISGLDHLNGATVSVLADGSVLPNVPVSGGSITLPANASTVTAGLIYTAQMQTLCMEPEGMAMSVQDYRKKISAVALRVVDTKGVQVGPNFNDLTEVKMRGPANPLGTAVPLFTGDMRVVIDNQYLVDDDVCIQQSYPLPCTILGVIPEVSIGDSPG
jgi:hypothetical protein